MSTATDLPVLELLPAVDVVNGQAVRLVQGEAGSETSYGTPLEAALNWQQQGAEWVHLVDLDAAFGRGSNAELLREVVGRLDIKVELLPADVVPHMGWNTVKVPEGSKLFAGVENERFYFVHSYGVQEWNFDVIQPRMAAPLVTWSEHGAPFIAAVENGPLCATQFHPEKSGDAGARLLHNWVEALRTPAPESGTADNTHHAEASTAADTLSGSNQANGGTPAPESGTA